MKKLLILLIFLLSMVFVAVSCGNEASVTTSAVTTTKNTVISTGEAIFTTADTTTKADETTAQQTTVHTTANTTIQTTEQTTAGTLDLIEAGKPVFQVVSSLEWFKDSFFSQKIQDFCFAIRDIGVTKPTYTYDQGKKATYEILIGKTNRGVTVPKMSALDFAIWVQGTKLVLYSESDYGVLKAVEYFTKTYLSERDGELSFAGDFCYISKYDSSTSEPNGMTYAEMASVAMDAFNTAFWNGKGVDIGFWEAAEIIEIYADAYELTRDEAIKEKLLSFADYFMLVNKQDWLWKNHNDSPMWACIAFTRITMLTGEMKYYTVAKKNFDAVYERSYDLSLGGGLYWDTDKTTKNACVNCPAAIAACNIAKISGDESYYVKAKDLMDWTIEVLFDKTNGRVADRYELQGGLKAGASTYNQGTFIGACTMIYQKYKDESYLTYAKAAADYAMINLIDTTYGVLDNNETRDGAALGFKGIFSRWARYLIQETKDSGLILFLQHNADVAFAHRNQNGLTWTSWKEKTPADPVAEKHNAFSMCTAVSLLYNCQIWK